MPKIKYKDITFRTATMVLINRCNEIIENYQAAGLVLTLRQLYYRLVAADVIPNTVKEYNKLGNAVSDARLAGWIDWNAIEDRTRNLQGLSHWNSPEEVIKTAARAFHVDKWSNQPTRVEVWIEKEALAGVFEQICVKLDVPYLSCRGYTSQSEMWGASQRFIKHIKADQTVQIFHFGDHDPSGIDMSRDIEDRLRMFISGHVGSKHNRFQIERVALNMDQVQEYQPPENPAKSTDTRFAEYERNFGDSSWELDALEPIVLQRLIAEKVAAMRDDDLYAGKMTQEAEARALLSVMASQYESTKDYMETNFAKEIDRRAKEERESLVHDLELPEEE